jgi:hypothetical protein
MIDIFVDALVDALKVLPFLFGAYWLMEYLEHRAGEKFTDRLQHVGAAGPVVGALLGVLPQCGFSVTAANFFAGHMISAGTLIAVFLSTSDEAVLLLLSQPEAIGTVGRLIAVKLVIAIVAGLLVDRLWKLWHKKPEPPFEELCRHCHCEHGPLWRSALNHTVKIFLFLLVINVLLGWGFDCIGEDGLRALFLEQSVWQPFLTALIGFIPNCAASVVLTKLFLAGTLRFGSTVAGLCTGAGLGLAVLLRTHHHVRDNVTILLILYGVSVAAGLLLNGIGF